LEVESDKVHDHDTNAAEDSIERVDDADDVEDYSYSDGTSYRKRKMLVDVEEQ
jgi:hypothetical protein